MDGPVPPAVFAGDLDDPWVANIAAALPAGTVRVRCAGDLPAAWPEAASTAPLLVLHRAVLTNTDTTVVARSRREQRFRRIVACIAPHARYHLVQKWASGLVDVVLPEAIAAEVIGRHVAVTGPVESVGPRPRLYVVSDQRDLRAVLADLGTAAGFTAEPIAEWFDVPKGALVVWDVPVLSPDWPAVLATHAGHCSIVAWLGFADRDLVQIARAAGAAACLDSTCEPADLAYVLSRLQARSLIHRVDTGHTCPRSPRDRMNSARYAKSWPRPLE